MSRSPGRETEAAGYFITSPDGSWGIRAPRKEHWSTGNRLRARLDVISREDVLKAGKDGSPLNLNVLRKIPHSVLRRHKAGMPKRAPMDKLMFMRALNPGYLLGVRFPGLK